MSDIGNINVNVIPIIIGQKLISISLPKVLKFLLNKNRKRRSSVSKKYNGLSSSKSVAI